MDRHPYSGFDFHAADLITKPDSGERVTIVIGHEREAPAGWVYEVSLTAAGGTVSTHEVSLAWCDHDHWTGGKIAPSRTLELVIAMSVKLTSAAIIQGLKPKYDAARLRRVCPGLDAAMGLHGGE